MRYIIIMILTCLTSVLRGQTLENIDLSSLPKQTYASSIRYWFDDDIGSLSITSQVGGTLTLNVSSLPTGLHTIHYQIMDDANILSVPYSSVFLRIDDSVGENTTAKEIRYWFDDATNANTLPAVNGISVIDTSHLTCGIHILHCQVTDNKGGVCSIASSVFLKVNAEEELAIAKKTRYWFDDDMTTLHEADIVSNVLSIDASGLTMGLHTLHYQTIDDKGSVTTPYSCAFMKQSENDYGGKKANQNIKEYRYWFNDASEKNVVQSVSPAVIPYTLRSKLPVTDVITDITPETIMMADDGDGHMKLATKNILHTQFCTEDGLWTPATCDTFAVVINEKDIDLTNFIKNPTATDKWNGWTTSGSTTGIQSSQTWNDGGSYFRLGSTSRSEWTASMTQTISGLPAGTYILSVKGRAATDVEMEVSANGFSDIFIGSGTEGGELTNGWNERSIIFTTDGLPFVIKVSGSANSSGKWMDVSDFRLTYSNASNASLAVSIPATVEMSEYKNLKMQLTSVSSKLSVTTSDSHNYTFQGLVAGVPYDLTITNRYGQTVVKKEGLMINEGENTLDLSGFAQLSKVDAIVLSNDKIDLTEKAKIEWSLPNGTTLLETQINGLLSGTRLLCNVTLGDSLGCIYHEVKNQEYTLVEGNNTFTISLMPIETSSITGKVVTENEDALIRATVSVTEWLNGKYSRTRTINTDTQGMFTFGCCQDSLHIVCSYEGYLDSTIDTLCTSYSMDFGSIILKEIKGITIETNVNYTNATEEGEECEATIYPDMDNVDFKFTNLSTKSSIDNNVIQSGKIVIKSGVAVGDRLSVRIHSRKGDFEDVTIETVVSEEETANAVFDVTEKGCVKASYDFSGNSENLAMLYNAKGELVSRMYYNSNKCSFSHLADGHYTLLSMGKTVMLDAIQNLKELGTIGLTENAEYVKEEVDVKAGRISVVDNNVIPKIDESLFFYTGTKTSFSVNKNNVVVGNYVTLTGVLDFKEEYAEKVDDISLIVDLPSGMEYVQGSAIIGTVLAPCSVDGNRLVISLNRDNYQERIRFCVVPTKSGSMIPTAYVAFSLDNDITQPIGSVSVTSTDMSISVPSTVAKPEVTISGVAVPYSKIIVYDGKVVMGQTTAKADGNWLVKGEFLNPYNLSTHPVYAEVLTPQNIAMNTEVVDVLYDKNAIEVKTVTMIYRSYSHVFDFKNPSSTQSSYSFNPSYTGFTFSVDLTNNNPEMVNDVYVGVKTSRDTQVTLKANYNAQQDRWIANGSFNSSALPVNVGVSFTTNTEVVEDTLQYVNLQNDINAIIDEEQKVEEGLENALNEFMTLIENDDVEKAVAKLETISSSRKTNHERDEDLYNELSNADNPDDISIIVDRYRNNLLNEVSEKTGVDLTNMFTDGSDNNEHVLNDCPYYDKPTLKAELPPEVGSDGYKNIQKLTNYKTDTPKNEQSDGKVIFKDSDGKVITVDYSGMMPQYPDLGVLSSQGFHNALSVPQKMLDWVDSKTGTYTADVTDIGFKLIEKGLEMQAQSICDVLHDIAMNKIALGDHSKATIDKVKTLGNKMIRTDNIANKVSAASKIIGGVLTAAGTYSDLRRVGDGDVAWETFIGDFYDHCSFTAAQELESIARVYQKDYRDKCWKLYWGNVGFSGAAAIGAACSGVSFGTSLFISGLGVLGTFAMSNWAKVIERDNKANYNALRRRASELGCKDFEPNGWEEYPGISTKPVIDPSGYVYEAVSSNRLEGVTATIYQKVTTEDMYGDKHDNIVKWDAEAYSQKNPIKTDAEGLYAWDVPNGLWQVKFEKDGYETVYSEWLPVPPPQLDINVPMYHSVQPVVTEAQGFESGVDFTFSKYMRPESFGDGCVTLSRDGSLLDGKLSMLNVEKEPLDSIEYASHIKFVPDQSLNVGDIVTLTISNKVKSYCGVAMDKVYSATLTIQPEINEIVVDSVVNINYGSTSEIAVCVLPEDAAKGKKLLIHNGSPDVIKMGATELILDTNGKAVIPVTGTLPGTGIISLGVEKSNVKTEIRVNVITESDAIPAPVASIESGSIVEKGSVVILSCPMEDVTIYYTLDGSCPCDETSRLVYAEPITINETLTIKAMAVGKDKTESEIAEFTYIVDNKTGVDNIVMSEGIEIYPLPIHDKLNISVGGKIIKSVTITSMNGAIAISEHHPSTKVMLDVSSLGQGIYVVNVVTSDKTYSCKVIKND